MTTCEIRACGEGATLTRKVAVDVHGATVVDVQVCPNHDLTQVGVPTHDLPEHAQPRMPAATELVPRSALVEGPDVTEPAKGMTVLTDETHARNLYSRIADLEADRAMEGVLLAEAEADPHNEGGAAVHTRNIETLDARLGVLRDAYDKALDAAVKAEKKAAAERAAEAAKAAGQS